MNLIWNFFMPSTPMSWGVATKNLVPMMLADGHNVQIAAPEYSSAPISVGGMVVIRGGDRTLLNMYLDQYPNIDYVISPQDPSDTVHLNKYVALALIDIALVPSYLKERLSKSKFQFCISRHNQREFKKLGYDPYYCPLGVDTEIYKPDEGARKRFRDKFNITNDTFLIGSVGVHSYSDRKNFINLLRGFYLFHKEFPNSKLYLHTNISEGGTIFCDFIRQSGGAMFPLNYLIKSLDLEDSVIYPDQVEYWFGTIGTDYMVDMYNGIDIFCLPTKGEAFGIPIVESQSCGTPVLVTDTTACTEIMKQGWLIPVDFDDYENTDNLSWVATVKPSKIYKYMKQAYNEYKSKEFVEEIKEYDWKTIYSKYWRPFLKILEEKK